LGVQQPIPSNPTRAQAALALGLLDTCWLRRPRLLRLCLRWTQGNLPDAEDLLSEAWLRAMEARVDASSIRRPFSFLATIIANLGRDRVRAARNNQLASYVPSEGTPAFASHEPGPDELACARESLEQVFDVLERVPGRQRSALLMRSRGDEYSCIARGLGTTEQNARKLVQFARAAVQGPPPSTP
jgi:RNA polymerase sigma-70 factor (ECF subfamily)